MYRKFRIVFFLMILCFFEFEFTVHVTLYRVTIHEYVIDPYTFVTSTSVLGVTRKSSVGSPSSIVYRKFRPLMLTIYYVLTMPRSKGVSRRHKAGTGNKDSRNRLRVKTVPKGTSSEKNDEKNCNTDAERPTNIENNFNTDAERPTNINPTLLPPVAVQPIETVSTPCLKVLKPVVLLKTISALKEAAVSPLSCRSVLPGLKK